MAEKSRQTSWSPLREARTRTISNYRTGPSPKCGEGPDSSDALWTTVLAPLRLTAHPATVPQHQADAAAHQQQAGTRLGNHRVQLEGQVLGEAADAVGARDSARRTIDVVEVELRQHVLLIDERHQRSSLARREDANVSLDRVVLEMPDRRVGSDESFDELTGRDVRRGERVLDRVISVVPAPSGDGEGGRRRWIIRVERDPGGNVHHSHDLEPIDRVGLLKELFAAAPVRGVLVQRFTHDRAR